MILEYNDFLLEKQLIRSRRDLTISIFSHIENIEPILTEAVEMVEMGIFDDLTFENINKLSDEQLYENIFQKAKEKFQKAKETIKDKGKEALSATQKAIVKFGGDVSKIIKLIIQKLAEGIKAAFEKPLVSISFLIISNLFFKSFFLLIVNMISDNNNSFCVKFFFKSSSIFSLSIFTSFKNFLRIN